MSGPHHFLPGLTNAQSAMRSQFGTSPMNNQMPQITGQMPVPMPPQMNNHMMAQISTNMSNPMNTSMASNTQMLGQQYSMNSTSQISQHQTATAMQMQQNTMVTSLQHHQMQQQPQVLSQQPSMPPTTQVQQQQQQTQQSKEFNTASLCRIGQETVQDIVSRTQEVFQTLKTIQPPNGTAQGTTSSNEKKVKVQEQLRTIRVLFKRLRLIYEKCNENCQVQGMEYTHIESLIPFKDEIDPKHDEKKNSEAYRMACEESKEVMEQVILKNKQLKEVIDHLRRIIWEINTMLTMRRS